MLTPEQYQDLMIEMERLSKWRKSLFDRLPQDENGELGINIQPLVRVSILIHLLKEVGEIEIDIRKKVREFTPSLPILKQEAILKCETRSNRWQNQRKKQEL